MGAKSPTQPQPQPSPSPAAAAGWGGLDKNVWLGNYGFTMDVWIHDGFATDFWILDGLSSFWIGLEKQGFRTAWDITGQKFQGLELKLKASTTLHV